MEKRDASVWDWIVIGLVFAAVLIALFATAGRASAHSWYDVECCHEADCSEVTDIKFVQPIEASGVPRLLVTTKVGTTMVPKDYKLRESKDGQMHACIKPYDSNPLTNFLCLYMPPGN